MLAFSLFLSVGTALGLIMMASQTGERRVLSVLDDAMWVLLGALAIGRATFVALNWGYFQTHYSEIPAIWSGGMSGPGALVGGIIAALILILLHGQNGPLLDDLVPLAGCLTLFAWLGCWYSGDAFGKPALEWLGLPGKDEWGVISLRFPAQLVGAVLALGTLLLIDRMQPKLKVAGQKSAIWLACFGSSLVALSFVRADPMRIWLGFRLDTLAGFSFTVAGILILLITSLQAVLKRRMEVRTSAHSEEMTP